MDSLTDKIVNILKSEYPNAAAELKYGNVYQLLISVILSAQCTDKRVNEVTKTLFISHGTPETMLALSLSELEAIIKPCGLYHSKAKHILSATKKLVECYNSEVPKSVDELTSLDGVGRKTALVTYAVGFNGAAFPVDTHVFRVSKRLGLADGNTPLKVEKQLCDKIDKSLWSTCHHYLILHGRRVCKAQKPCCTSCTLNKLCPKIGVGAKKS